MDHLPKRDWVHFMGYNPPPVVIITWRLAWLPNQGPPSECEGCLSVTPSSEYSSLTWNRWKPEFYYHAKNAEKNQTGLYCKLSSCRSLPMLQPRPFCLYIQKLRVYKHIYIHVCVCVCAWLGYSSLVKTHVSQEKHRLLLDHVCLVSWFLA